MRVVLLAILAAWLCAACSASVLLDTWSMTDEERCAMDRGMWRAGQCQACGGGM